MEPSQYLFEAFPLHPPPEPWESFTGFLARVAELNQIESTRGISRLLIHPHYTLFKGDYLYKGWQRILSFCVLTETQLKALTFTSLLNKFDRMPSHVNGFFRGSLVDYRRFCPCCLAERRWYLLPWGFLGIKGCAIHAVRLQERCGHCGSDIPLFKAPFLTGVCPRCQAKLWLMDAEPLPPMELEETRQNMMDLIYLLQPQTWEQGEPRCVPQLGRILRQERELQGRTRGDAANILGVTQAVIAMMEHFAGNTGNTNFRMLWNYVNYLHLSWSNLFTRALEQSDMRDTVHDDFQLHVNQHERVQEHVQVGNVHKVLGLSTQSPRIQSYIHTIVHRYQQQHDEQSVRAAIMHMQIVKQEITLKKIRILSHLSTFNFNVYPELLVLVNEAQMQQQHTWETERTEQVMKCIVELQNKGAKISFLSIGRELHVRPEELKRYEKVRAAIIPYLLPHFRQRVQVTAARLPDVVSRIKAAKEKHEQREELFTIHGLCAEVGESYEKLYVYPELRSLFQDYANQIRCRVVQRKQTLTANIQTLVSQVAGELERAGIEVTQARLWEKMRGRTENTTSDWSTLAHHSIDAWCSEQMPDLLGEEQLLRLVTLTVTELEEQVKHSTPIAVARHLQISLKMLMHFARVQRFFNEERGEMKRSNCSLSGQDEL